MTSLQKLTTVARLLGLRQQSRAEVVNVTRNYSVFNPTYVKPVFRPEEQEALDQEEELKALSLLPIKPAFTDDTSSEFYDKQVSKFINFLMREGKKERARKALENTFENIKRIQLEKYNKATDPAEKEKIELDPRAILRQAIENSTPVLELLKMKKGGQTYQVPVPLTEKRAQFLGMNWLIQAGKDKQMKVHLSEKLAHELIDAANNEGRVIKKKQELYRQCEANRSYAHFRWF
ncbi:28S ribosomal protein S7, mitochondrial [Trichogramma pretiosum]|uniref:28S ribosomal protein S7, mitochondrial n=1 Tax=Trichogramma pretiosum TaxID=7493 RepID=UPI0006C9AF52|nr:28S ribosomal protein S7, mitochondrial [Trichogramma pretiosum]